MHFPLVFFFYKEKFRNVVPMYFERTHFVLVVFSLTDQESFKRCSYWVTLAREKTCETSKIIIIGNKCDLVYDREVSTEELMEFVQMVRSGKGVEDYREFIAPVFISDAIIRSFESGETVEIVLPEV